jgi:hypothetical protein
MATELGKLEQVDPRSIWEHEAQATFAQNDRLRVELYIDTGYAEKNLEIFEHLSDHRDEIEQVYGGELAWEELPSRRACRIAAYKNGGCTILDQNRHDEYIDWLLDTGDRLRKALATVTIPA